MDALTFEQMCRREGIYLQRGMYARTPRGRPVLLISPGKKNVYADMVEERAEILIYEGHNAMRSPKRPYPQLMDQPLDTVGGKRTANGVLFDAAASYRDGTSPAMPVQIYRKIRGGVWMDLGEYRLVDAWRESDGRRLVVRFKLRRFGAAGRESGEAANPRYISPDVRVRVWNRDGGRCVICGSTRDLHFDHIVPVVRGGGNDSKNLQLLCSAHNLAKSDDI